MLPPHRQEEAIRLFLDSDAAGVPKPMRCRHRYERRGLRVRAQCRLRGMLKSKETFRRLSVTTSFHYQRTAPSLFEVSRCLAHSENTDTEDSPSAAIQLL